ncbi:hypothetical protein QD460_17800 [Rhizobium jaguaris]|uniref:Farnesoic acid O-methyl transferase domain-containing protein n=1 Tax=Rhizobium jaguaris TaxID=1312183 RepID=A0A387FSQ1_9HYPH|nr:hypothetical protein [Rhizobium jaguaris]AYG61503.1 hypothetical protein CCGE525_16715 [Rhizobium jaguaris]
MTPVILVTFAGRQKRMEILTKYIRKAINDGIIDEWHIWDFTRSSQDNEWVTREFGPARYMRPEAPYQLKGTVAPRSSFRTNAKIDHDLHIAVLPNGEAENYFEIVVGGWVNTHSVLRTVKPSELDNFANRGEAAVIWSKSTPGVLSPSQPNQVVLSVDSAGIPTLQVNGVIVGTWPELNLSSGASVMVRGGWGADLELCDVNAPVRRYVGNPNEKLPYWQAYDYYAKRLEKFSSAVFLKCDDDIVYLDIEKLNEFIEFRRANPNYFVVSANVVNNGVCAYFQQLGGALPDELGHFERPPGGFGGSLWLSAERATQLHDFFLEKNDKHLPLPNKVVEWKERQSINFISWLGKDLLHMALPKGDDEYALTVDLPTFLDRPTAIYADFTVSHLSFGPQEQGLDVDRLINAYDALTSSRL